MSNEPRQSDADGIDKDLELLAVARLGFKRRLELLGADDWAKPTPCTEWDVRQLVNHVVGSDLRYTDLLSGGRADDFTRRSQEETGSTSVVGNDPVEDWACSGAALDAAFRKPGAMERVVDYPWGPLRGRELLENRIVDITIHTWDLARAIDTDDTLDERLVRRCLSARFFQPRTRDNAGPQDANESPSGTARRQDRLLRASGRSPT
jgi:uncharacterized protein (TIGR03086 family)